jgi:hypothetical protein
LDVINLDTGFAGSKIMFLIPPFYNPDKVHKG